MVDIEVLEEISIVDFVFDDKLTMNSEKPQSFIIYLTNLWSKGDIAFSKGRKYSWKNIDKSSLTLLIYNLLYFIIILENLLNVMNMLCQNLHDLHDSLQFAIDPG